MKQLIDLMPGIAFIVAYFAVDKDFVFATFVLIVASAIQLTITWLIWRRIEKMHIYIFLMLLPLGAMTILFDDPRFLKWKPTIVNWVFALVLLASHEIWRKNLSQAAIEGLFKGFPDMQLTAPAPVWKNINRGVALFFIIVGVLNLVVAFNFSDDTWVTFKVFGLVVFNLAGMITLFTYLYPYMNQLPNTPPEPVSRDNDGTSADPIEKRE